MEWWRASVNRTTATRRYDGYEVSADCCCVLLDLYRTWRCKYAASWHPSYLTADGGKVPAGVTQHLVQLTMIILFFISRNENYECQYSFTLRILWRKVKITLSNHCQVSNGTFSEGSGHWASSVTVVRRDWKRHRKLDKWIFLELKRWEVFI